MSRDFKHRTASGKRSTRSQMPTWASMVIGLTGGLLVALTVFLYYSGQLDLWAVQARPWGQPSVESEGRGVDPGTKSRRQKPRFEFYSRLPEMEVVVPEREVVAPPPRAAATKDPGRYILQVGSFRRIEEADRLKANLALLGLEAEIQAVSVNGTDTWHRVRLGPFTDMAEVQATRERLRANQLSAMVLK